ncbi:MAG: phosphoenolpyruvate--protein phosphotransferase [Candidatus Hydrogenedentota bacterium]
MSENIRHYLEVFRSLTYDAAGSGTPHERLSRLVSRVATELRWDVCSIYVLDEAGGSLVLTATHGLDHRSVGRIRIPIAEGLVGCAASEEKPIFLANAAQDARFRYFPETGEERFVSMAAVPMMRDGRVSGVLTVQTVEPYEFSTADRHFLEILAQHIAQVVDVALTLRSVRSSRVHAFHGTAVSPGIAEARVHLFESSPDRITVAARGFRGLDFEMKLFEKAMSAALAEINQLVHQLNSISPPAAQIFIAHRMMIEDPMFQQDVRKHISKDSESAPRAVAKVMNAYIEKFASIGNPVLQEKSSDLKGLRDTLLRLMMDEKVTRFAPEFEEENMVVVARELTPQQMFQLDASKVVAVLTEKGSESSHVAIIARALNFPAIVGVEAIIDSLHPEDRVLVDGASGYVFVNPDEDLKKQYFARMEENRRRVASIDAELTGAAIPPDRVESDVFLDANIGLPFEIEEATKKSFTAVGLFRTEFFYMQHRMWPDEKVQRAFYARLLNAFPTDTVAIRLLDIGGDKFLSYLPAAREENPHLGFRSVRLLLANPEILRSQIRAIHEAAKETGKIPRILVPMVTHTWELVAVKEILLDVTQGVAYPMGIMVEVPGALFQIEEFAAEADFISIGTNDLAQYLLAVDRNNARVNHLSHPLHPSLLRALSHLRKSLAAAGKPYSVCGEMAGDPISAMALLILGYRHLTIAPPRVSEIRYMLRCLPKELLPTMADPLLSMGEAGISEKILRLALREHAPLLA